MASTSSSRGRNPSPNSNRFRVVKSPATKDAEAVCNRGSSGAEGAEAAAKAAAQQQQRQQPERSSSRGCFSYAAAAEDAEDAELGCRGGSRGSNIGYVEAATEDAAVEAEEDATKDAEAAINGRGCNKGY